MEIYHFRSVYKMHFKILSRRVKDDEKKTQTADESAKITIRLKWRNDREQKNKEQRLPAGDDGKAE